MSRPSHALLNLIAITAFVGVPATVRAQQVVPQSEVRGGEGLQPAVQQRRSLSDAVRRVERNTRGEVLSAERVQYDGRDMHRIKVVDDRGRVRVYMRDPARAAASQIPQGKSKDD